MVAVILTAAAIAAVTAGASALIATGTIALAAIATAAIGAAISAGIAYLLRPRAQVGSASRAVRQTVRAAVGPARYVLGQARTGGVMFFALEDPEDPATIHVVMGISEGDLEGVDAFWVGGQYVRTGPVTDLMGAADNRIQRFDGIDQYEDQFTAFVYLDSSDPAKAADNGVTMRSVFPDDWTTAHALPIAWVHIVMTSAISDNDGDGTSERTFRDYTGLVPGTAEKAISTEHQWRSVLEPIEILVRGMRVTWPGQETPTYTQNAAALRYWYDTEILGRTVELEGFNAAYAICEQEAIGTQAIDITPTPGATASVEAGMQIVVGGRLAVAGETNVTLQISHQLLTPAMGETLTKTMTHDADTTWTIDSRAPLDDDYANAIGSIILAGVDGQSVEITVTVTEPA